jgi:hypothetical protein
MSKLLQRLLSAAIFPAALMIVGKVVGMYIANRFFNLGWSITTEHDGIFSVQIIYPSLEAAVTCNSYSNLIMLLFLMFGNAFLIFQGYFLHPSHQNPRVLVKLIHFDFLAWLSDSPQLYPRIAVWLAFLWVATIIVITQSIQGLTYPWVSITGFALTIFATFLVIRDVEEDLKTILPENGKLNAVKLPGASLGVSSF